MDTLSIICGIMIIAIPLVSLLVAYAVMTLRSDKEFEELVQRVEKRKKQNQKDNESK